jgi:SAM-dependent methyltransferase
MKKFEQEVQEGERFEFGANWARFLRTLNEDSIAQAEVSLRKMLGLENLRSMRFLDIGCGSGLFSLAARRLGAFVYSFDYDPNSVGCAQQLKQRFFPGDPDWIIQQGSALDVDYLRSLGDFDVVYSWGVLHHTGAMWEALGNAALPVRPQGRLFIAIYNDQGKFSRRWTSIKRLYNTAPAPVPILLAVGVLIQQWWRPIVKDLLLLRPFATWRAYGQGRGMTPWRDVIDWVGGYPFEVAKPEQLLDFYRARGFELIKMTTCGGTLGCNEFVFIRQHRTAVADRYDSTLAR